MSSIFKSFLGGKDNFKIGIVNYEKYTFLFLKCDSTFDLSSFSKLSPAGAYWGMSERFLNSEIKDAKHCLELFNYDVKIDLLFAGSLKTLIPTLLMGGDERLFEALIIIKDPNDNIFSIMYYFGPSGTAIATSDDPSQKEIAKNVFLGKVPDEKVLNPFKLSKHSLRKILDALEGALRKVPMTDYQAIYEHDFGKVLMGLEDGIPFIQEINLRI